MGGADGHLYELQYAAGERWRQKRCTKVCHTGGIRGFLPSFVPAFLFGAPAALVDLKVDDEKGVLYARTSTSGIQVFDLGSTSGGSTSSTSHAPNKVAECTDFLADASRAPINGREVFGRGGGDKRGASVVYMSPIPSSDSSRLHFLTVTADGRRVYWSVASPARLGRSFPRPERLRAEVARQAVPSSALIQRSAAGAGGGGGGGGMLMMANRPSGAGGGRSLEVVAAHYSNGCLLLAEASPAPSSSSSIAAAAQQPQQQQQQPRRTRLFLLTRDLTIPPVGTATGAHIGVQGLRENVSELEIMTSLPGEACAISNTRSLFLLNTATGNKSGGGVRDDATSLNLTPPPRFVVVTTAGVVETERQRPVDILGQLLEEKVSGSGSGGVNSAAAKIDMFFKSYGAAEAAAICILLASGTPAGGVASSSASLSARAVLEDARLVGEPILYDSTGAITTDLTAAADPYQQQQQQDGAGGGWYASAFDMGAPVPVAEPDWSGAHKGLALHVSRMLSGIWDESVAVPATSSGSGGGQVPSSSGGGGGGRDGLLKCRFSGDVLAGLEARLRSLDAWLGEYLVRKKARQQQHESRGLYYIYSGGDGGGQQQGDQHHQQMNGHYHHHPAPDGLPTPSAKRQRLMEDAARQEIVKCETIRALISRASQACFLLRVLSEHNLGRLAARAEESHRMALQSIRFRDWVASQEGEAVAAALVSVLVAEHLHATGGVAEDLAAALASGCPAYFREEDKTFYQASGLLQRAEAAGTVADREALTQEAVGLMSRVPLVVDLGQVVPQLAHLHAMHAVVDLTARKAAAVDPSNLAATSGHGGGNTADTDGGEIALRKRYDGCYQHVVAVLRVLYSSSPSAYTNTSIGGAMLLNGSATTTANATASLETFEKSLTSPAQREALKHSLLSRLMLTDDQFFHEAIFSAIMSTIISSSSSNTTSPSSVSIKDLIALESPYLEPYLIRAGGLEGAATATATTGGPSSHHHQKTKIGPLSSTQAAHADALARLYISRDQYGAAARVYELLAERMAAPGEADVSLTGRVSSLQRAILQARSCGDGTLLDRLESKSRVMVLQSTMVAVLERTLGEMESYNIIMNTVTDNGGEGEQQQQQVYMEQLKAAVSELSSEPKELAELYNDYAVPLCLWKLCLEAIDISGYGDAGYVEQLWDLFLKETWHRALPSSGTTSTTTTTAAAELCLEMCCREVEALGETFYPNESSFPATHITMRLESIAGGHWPSPESPPAPSPNISSMSGGGDVLGGGGGSRVARALVKACKGGAEAVVRVYEELLTSPGGGGQDVDGGVGGGNDDGSKEMLLQSPEFRLRLLKSAFVVTLAARESVSNKAAIGGGGAGTTAIGGGGMLRAGGRREASLLAAACDAFVAESRRLVGVIVAGGGGEEEEEDVERLSVEWEVLRKSVSGLLGYSRW